jgi:hypothetical protein
MGRIYLVKYAAILFISISFCYSQFIPDYGLKVGLVSSNFESKYWDFLPKNEYSETRLGSTVSFFIYLYSNKHFNLETDISYVQKGGQEKSKPLDYPEGVEEAIFDIQFDYLQYNLSFNPKFQRNSYEVYFISGIGINYLLRSSGSMITNRVKKINYGFSIGLGFALNDVIKHSLLFEVLYNSDIGNIEKNDFYKYKNKILVFRFGIRLGSE